MIALLKINVISTCPDGKNAWVRQRKINREISVIKRIVSTYKGQIILSQNNLIDYEIPILKTQKTSLENDLHDQ